MHVKLLGTGSALTSDRRSNTSIVVESAQTLLVDCSGTPPQALARLGVDWTSLGELLLTHRHPDHVYGILSLAHQLAVRAHRAGPARLTIRGQELALRLASSLLEAVGLRQRDDLISFELEPLPDEVQTHRLGDLEVTTFPVSHGDVPALGVKVTPSGAPRRAVVLSGDSQPCEAIFEQSRNAALLVHECSVFTGEKLVGHTSQDDLPGLVATCGAERIVLVHLPPLTPLEEGRVRRELARRFGGRVTLGEDGQTFEL